VELHFLDAPVDVLFGRIQRRNAESPAITLEDVNNWAAAFERPAPEEIALYDASASPGGPAGGSEENTG